MPDWYSVVLIPLHGKIVGTVVFVTLLLLLQIVIAEVEAPTFQYIARRLSPNECQSMISNEVAEPFNLINPIQKSYKLPSSEIDCFRKLVAWASNFRIDRRDVDLLLGNRLRQIGRNDLATWLVGPSPGGGAVSEETIEYDSWGGEKVNNKNLKSPSDPKTSGIDRSMHGSPQTKSLAGLSPVFHQQSIISPFPDMRKLNGIHNLDSFKDRYLAMAEPNSVLHPVTSAPGYVSIVSPGRGDLSGSVSTPTENDPKDSKSLQTVDGKIPDEQKRNDSKFSKLLPHFNDGKTAPCLRVPLGTALVVIGTIMILTCCCALLLRNRLSACFERLRGKKTNNKTSKRLSIDEEQGFMGPRTVGKPPKKSGRRGGGPIDVANVGVQKSSGNPPSNGSGELDEKPTGCCNCCARKKKKNRKKWKK